MDQNLSTGETMEILMEANLADKARFEREGVNLSAYNNVETAADIAMIMSHLGYEKFNLVGSSAGTMVAHHVMRDYPEMLTLKHPETGEEFSYAMNGYRLAESMLMHMYYTTQLPYLIGPVLEGDFSSLTEGLSYGLLPNYFADGLGQTVFISESAAYSNSAFITNPRYRIFEEGITRSGMGANYISAVGKVWDIDKLEPARLRYSGQVDVPVLVLNGKYDPVIPERFDEVMKKDLKNCYVYRFDGVPHSAFDNATPCALPMLLQFLADPSKAPDSSCMENYKQVYRLPGQ